MALRSPPLSGGGTGSSAAGEVLDLVLGDFTARWERGESPRAEEYFGPLTGSEAGRVELIYREFCLAEWSGLDPRPEDYLARFPGQREALGRLLGVHDALGSSGLGDWAGPDGGGSSLPEVGDEIGPYRLIRELGRGGFARVFLAEQADLDDRLVVVKVATRVTPEPRLLARASHPNIVEVLWHGVVDGGAMQVLCMPFLGGATLAEVLAVGRAQGARPGSGRELLEDLDRVSAAGFLPPTSGRPAREVIARLSYPKSAAWVVARLAEALDHAYSRGVLHGDVKPSNVLLAADGTPMLLDFNLAVGWRPYAPGHGERELLGEAGGTLAYMAPERLSTVAATEDGPLPRVADRHRADVYALGVVLLEMLTGRAPELPGGRTLSPRERASAYASSRSLGVGAMIRATRTPLPAGLRGILARCLATDPADRYGRARELAEDLERWRTDRPLAFAREPSWSLGVASWARRRRRALTAAATGLAVAVVVTAGAWWAADVGRREQSAIERYSQVVASEESGAFLALRPGVGLIAGRGNPAAVARRHLERYGVLGPGDWRRRDEFRNLPLDERAELEVWLAEQALRFALALADRPDAPDDWRRGLECIGRVSGSAPPEPLLGVSRRLRHQLGLQETPDNDRPSAGPAAPRWAAAYLRGVSAELAGDLAAAADHYEAALRDRPDSFWANYRAAAVSFARAAKAAEGGVAVEARDGEGAARSARAAAFRLYADASARLQTCVRQRPDNPTLRRQFAGCLHGQHRYQEAAEQCDAAQKLDPDHAETYLSRSILRLELGQVDHFLKDIRRYDSLTGDRESAAPVLSPLLLAPGREADDPPRGSAGRRDRADPNASELEYFLAIKLWKAGDLDLALGEIDRLLVANPEDIRALYTRGLFRFQRKEAGADQDFLRVVSHPDVETFVGRYPSALRAFEEAVLALFRGGRTEDALSTAERGVSLSERLNCRRGKMPFRVARACAVAAEGDPALRREAARYLDRAFKAEPEHARKWFASEPAFDALRSELAPLVR